MLIADASYADLWFWVWLWKILLVGVVTGFTAMAVWVTIGGVADIKRLLARIRANHEADSRRHD
ncbi:MAG TPA: hypothetical protein DD670_03515 [Planctomycetaceae bacterium]|nr:hypothetical protein [Planctomycetaceae bacterium]